MAKSKKQRSRSSRKKPAVPEAKEAKPRRPAFAEVKGKVVERVEVSTISGACAIGILFEDRTYLGFDIDPFVRITPDFSDFRTGNYKPLKRWPPVESD